MLKTCFLNRLTPDQRVALFALYAALSLHFLHFLVSLEQLLSSYMDVQLVGMFQVLLKFFFFLKLFENALAAFNVIG